MTSTAREVLESVSDDEFPILVKLLESEAGELLRDELVRLLERRWASRAPRIRTDVMARIRSAQFDEAVVIRNVSSSGVLVLLEPSSRVALQDKTLHLRVRSQEGLIDLPVDFVRVAVLSRGRVEAAFTFETLSDSQQEALDELSHLLYIQERAVPGMNSEPS